MPQFKLKIKGWHDEYEHLTYLVLEKDGKEIWQSRWYEDKEFFEYASTIDDLKNSVQDAANEFNIEIDTESDDYWEWYVKS